MFESAELGRKVGKAQYEREVPKLRETLLHLQNELRESSKFQVIILINGVDGAGKSETVKILNEWMDPRFIETNAMAAPTEEERAHPPMWRFWRALPPRGKIGIFFGSWYTEPIVGRVYGTIKGRVFDEALERVVRFEKMLVDEGALILKFWLHLSKEVQKKRLEKLERNPETRWRVTETEWAHFKLVDKFRKISERALRHTSTAEAPWLVVEGVDPRYRYLAIAKAILEAMRTRLDDNVQEAKATARPLPVLPPVTDRFLLKSVDYSQGMTKKEYDSELEKYQRRLNLLVRGRKFRKASAILVFEGSDAAGKGGAIRRVTGALDPRWYRIVPIAAPTQEERLHPYLWRFWRNIQRKGTVTIFDRSWYGRLLVERVEGFCEQADWMRAYGEINDFEEQIAQCGGVVIKFWLSITKDEQLRRFKEREATSFKRFKITEEDWRNRRKWKQYEVAVEEMIDRTSTVAAPWTVVEANNKYHARIKILKQIFARLGGG